MIRSKTASEHQVLQKEGGSSLASQVVTEVDLESQGMILEVLEDSLGQFELGLLTEESPDDSSRLVRDYFWCIDPLDGTLAFTKGTAGYAVVIALVGRDGVPRIGVVYDPVTDTLYHAVRGQGARKNGDPWVPGQGEAGAPLTLMIDNSFIETAAAPAFRDRLEAVAIAQGCGGYRILDHAGAVLNACQVVDEAPALYFKFPKPTPGGGSLWDFAATTCFFNELGLPVSDVEGNPLRLNPEGSTFMNHCGVLYASDPALVSSVAALRG